MEFIFELLTQFFVEIFAQMFFEILAEIGIKSFANSFRFEKSRNPILSVIGYMLLASMGAGLSLWIFPSHLITNLSFRIMNLIFTPILIGFVMSRRGKSLRSKEKQAIRLDTFAYGYIFALTFAVIRFWFAK